MQIYFEVIIQLQLRKGVIWSARFIKMLIAFVVKVKGYLFLFE